MSHYEKALKQNYGGNFDSGSMTIQQSTVNSPMKLNRL